MGRRRDGAAGPLVFRFLAVCQVKRQAQCIGILVAQVQTFLKISRRGFPTAETKTILTYEDTSKRPWKTQVRDNAGRLWVQEGLGSSPGSAPDSAAC